MFRTIIVAEDASLSNALQTAAMETGFVNLLKLVEGYANAYEVARTLAQHDPELILVEATSPVKALSVAQEFRERSPGIAVCAIGVPAQHEIHELFTSEGVAPLTTPLSAEEFEAGIRWAVHAARPAPLQNLWLFVPSKAGNGASTLVLNAASRLTSELGKRVLVIEADLHSGVLSMLLGVTPRYPVLDVLHASGDMPAGLWEQAITQAAGFDLLLTDRVAKPPLPTWAHYHQLLRFAAARYDTVLVDLPEVVNSGTAELVHYAARVFLVCTPELPSLTLAGQRLRELGARGLDRGRVGAVVNRWHRGDASTSDIEGILQIGVDAVLRNDYATVHKATMAGKPVKAGSDLGKSYLEFAKRLARQQEKKGGLLRHALARW